MIPIEIVISGKLRTIPGVGEAIAEKIIRLHQTGSHPTLDYLREQYPPGLLEMFEIPGLGAKKIEIIHTVLKLITLEQLEAACKDGAVAACKGLGKALEAKILKGLELRRAHAGAMLADAADHRLRDAAGQLRASTPDLSTVEPAGEVRRGCETVRSLVLAACGEPAKRTAPPAPPAPDVQLAVGAPEHFGATLLFATGSAAHVEALCARAAGLKLSLTERGLFRGKTALDCRTENDIYSALKLAYIPPELREGGGEIVAAEKHALPKLVEAADLRGILHSHTTSSDGARSLHDMAEAVRKRGYQYYGVADHSQSAAYAGGMKEDKVRAQWKIADELNAGYVGKNFHIFKGVESDILAEGALDYPDAFIAGFDFVVASVHSRFSLDKEKQTARLLNAVANPRTTILGHITGRLLLKRDGYDIDIDAVLQACAKHGVAVEINAHPQRLDLDWRFHRRALELGCMFSINPDAHDIPEIDLVRYGVNIARKGWVPADRVLNTKPLEEITEFFAKRRARR